MLITAIYPRSLGSWDTINVIIRLRGKYNRFILQIILRLQFVHEIIL